ncbi:MAG: carboxypeptidase regulatory-like domain-containing protein [Candidatus Acidiferrales bacterium]
MACVFLFAFTALSLHAQAVTGNISGTVTDSTGAVIAGAQVVVTNTATGVSSTLTSNDQGRYNAPDLVVGPYQVQASKTGFQSVLQKNVSLTVGSQLVVNLTLPVGQAQETVTVESAVSQVETQSTAISSLVSPKQMVDLPLNGRNYEQLLNLAPGVTPVGGGAGALYGNGASFSIAGARTEGEEFLLDDTNMQDFWNHSAGSASLGTTLGVEAIQEFSLLTNTYSAQFGGNGAVMNAVSKSGTNSFHGSAYEFLRNSALDSRSYFDLTPSLQPYKPAFRRNQFGGSLGGPIKKNKLFFFGNYEGLRQALGQTVAGVTLPEPYVANGWVPSSSVFGPLPPSCAGGTPSAPAPATGGPYTFIPFGCASGQPAAAAAIAGILGIYNKTTPPASAKDLGGYYGTTVGATQNSSENYILGRIDYTLSATDSIFGRYVSDRAYNLSPIAAFGSDLPYWPEVDHTRNQYFTAEERHIFSANVVNNARLMLVRTFESSYSNSTLPASSDPLAFIPSRHEDASVTPCILCPGLSGVGSDQFVSDTIAQNTVGVGDDVAWIHGAHTVTFGADILRVQSNVNAPFMYGDFYLFLNLPSFLEGSSLLGYGVQQSPYTDIPNRYFREIDINPYINDSWKVSSRLTLNLGVRYDFGSNPSGWPFYTITNPPYGNGGFSPVSHAFQTSPNRKNIDPRIGLAWAPFGDQKTSIRAGFGIFHDPVAPRTYASAYYFSPPFNYHELIAPGFPDPFAGQPAALPPQEQPTACAADNIVNNSTACINLGDGVPYTTTVAPYQEQWNLNVQRELGAGTVLTVGYVGSRGVHLFSQRNLNPSIPTTATTVNEANPANCPGPFCSYYVTPAAGSSTCVPTLSQLSSCYFGAFTPAGGGSVEPVLPRLNNNYSALNENVTGGRSSYNSLQVSLVRQAARGVTMQVSYTYSHCLDDGSGSYGLELGALGQLDPYDSRYDYGDCQFDLRHNVVANVIYQLPFHGNRLIEGWQLSGIFTAQSGAPFSISDGFDQAGLFNNAQDTRPDAVAGCDPYAKNTREPSSTTNILEPVWLNSSCFSLEPAGTLGNAGRNTLFGPRNINLDFALLKNTRITERLSAQFRAEFFNIANRTDFGAPGATLYSGVCTPSAPPAPPNPTCVAAPSGGDGGTVNPTYGFIGGTIPNSQREIQFAVKLIF